LFHHLLLNSLETGLDLTISEAKRDQDLLEASNTCVNDCKTVTCGTSSYKITPLSTSRASNITIIMSNHIETESLGS